ncbi:MAG: CDP-alcohol phosphatidyltransferase family protein [Lachnospiraceae bacterium]|nr:CDP-alcohol phosphatidyltransferase family protein [Lachnospiraceae bacterium]
MIGYYNYTVILTYLSLVSAGLGITITLMGQGHPFLGTFFLLFCGLCDAFDGEVARRKKNRTEEEIKFGVQIDSLSDLVAFGVLPAVIGEVLVWQNPEFTMIPKLHTGNPLDFVVPLLCFLVMMLYVLMAMIRLAYFNVMEEKRQKEEGGKRKSYTGLPVTSAALIFPFVMLLQFMTPLDMTVVYYGVMVLVGYLFVSKIEVKKPGVKGVGVLCIIGALEFTIMALLRSCAK